jgi:hypothetical protein
MLALMRTCPRPLCPLARPRAQAGARRGDGSDLCLDATSRVSCVLASLLLGGGGCALCRPKQTSCDQEIAADGVFAAAMLTEYRASLEAFGPWFYRRLYWETGVIGQVLYLETEASGIAAPASAASSTTSRTGSSDSLETVSRCSTTSPWAGRSTIHACRPIHRISISRVPMAARSRGSSAYVESPRSRPTSG